MPKGGQVEAGHSGSLEQRRPTLIPPAQVPSVRVSRVAFAGSDAIRMAVSVMHAMSGSEVERESVNPVRLNLEMFWRTRRSRTISPGSAKGSLNISKFNLTGITLSL